ncbi:helix-turn-helix domain-containing protein [Irregularibacter muris]|uniref:Helix-turn-helix domain-containing protein n=1 Tax=Irregularibacter muris TaxID=1796619 RepID=A0AAE3KZJ2_9FIRM|nr:helix-turn-helix transcriptional regulator [Irregularibacter muris]MCR1899325.1 helix-turn-helix domain-containing protein [Irregularibacter muris]
MDTIGKRIRYARKMNKLSLMNVKEKTGISTGNLSELENDKFAPSAHSLIAFKKLFNVSIDWLLTGEPPITTYMDEVVKETSPPLLFNNEEEYLLQAYRILDREKRRDIQGYINVATQQKLCPQENNNK